MGPLPPDAFHMVVKSVEEVISLLQSKIIESHPTSFIACSVLLLPPGCLSRDVVISVCHTIQYKFCMQNAHQVSKHSQQCCSLLPVPAGLYALKTINPKLLLFKIVNAWDVFVIILALSQRRETLWINKLTADLKSCPVLKSHLQF